MSSHLFGTIVLPILIYKEEFNNKKFAEKGWCLNLQLVLFQMPSWIMLTCRPSHYQLFDRMRNSIKIWLCSGLEYA